LKSCAAKILSSFAKTYFLLKNGRRMWQSLKKGKMEQFFVELPLARKSAKKCAF